MKKRICAILLSLAVMLSLTVPALATATEKDTAVQYLTEQSIYQGDQNGNFNLDSGLTRAELAVILTRLDYIDSAGGLADWETWGKERFSDPATRSNKFTDVPDWALPHVEYCYQRGLMKGVADTRFDPLGKVNPQMACTVILRYCGIPETTWSYATSVSKAQDLGIAPGDGVDSDTLLRGTMAVIIYRGIHYDVGTLPTDPADPAPDEQASAMTIEEMKLEIVRLTNEERVKAGLPELEVLPELMDCAQAKAQDFLDSHYYGHDSPIYGTPLQMVLSFGISATGCSENAAPGRVTATEVMTEWMESETHRSNILNAKRTHTGVGIIPTADGMSFMWVAQMITLK